MTWQTSNVNAVPYVMKEIIRINPHQIIDMGCGSGKYGLLCRELLREIDCLDGFDPKAQLTCGVIYDDYQITWLDYYTLKQDYDLALLIAVIYHFNPEQIRTIYQEKWKGHVKTFMFTIEKEQHGNFHQWTLEELESIFGESQMCKDIGEEYLIVI